MSRPEKVTAIRIGVVVLALHVLGFFLLIALLAPRHYVSVGVGLTAYTLGLRHAFDADHIAAIDNTTRKLMSEGKRPMSVGFFFSLGHSTVVFVLALLFALGIRALDGPVRHGNSTLHAVTNLIGTGVSGTFLYAIAAINLLMLVRMLRSGHALEQSGGVLTRVFGRFTRAISSPRQMYPVGLLFGLGFDTATEVALLFLAAGAAGAGMPIYAVLGLPILFAAGMSLLDTIEGSFMNFAYGWALSNPARKRFYNLVITGLSVAVALIIGTIELAGLIVPGLGAGVSWLGFIIVGLFATTWLVAIAVWRLARIEERSLDRARRR